MSHLEIHSKVGSDGSLILNVPLGISQADREVKITLDSSSESQEISSCEWQKKIEETAGKWEGEPLERPEQGVFENRNDWK